MIEINNLTNFRVDKRFFAGVAKKVLSGENKETEGLSIAFIGKKEIQKINKKYRNKNKPTDVLSFKRNGEINGDEPEVVICPEIVKQSAKKLKISFKKEMANVLIHGILHILGYNHELSAKEAEKMFKKQEKYLREFVNRKS